MADGDGEGFHDYTVSSTFEKFVAVLEAAMLNCVKKGVGRKRVVVLPHGFVEWRKEDYVLTWYDAAQRVDDKEEEHEASSVWPIQSYPVKFHEWFFPEAFFLIEPDSYSRRILHDQEFSTVMSAVCVAMNALKASRHDAVCRHPVYVPKHDARRDAYGGVRVSRDGLQRFECDSIHGSVGNGIEYVSEMENRVALLMSRVPHGCSCDVPLCWTRMTYQVYQDTDREGDHIEGDVKWDSDMPWGPWARLEDPVGGVDVDVLHMDGNEALGDAKRMRILAMASDHAPDSGKRSFIPLQVSDVSRKFLQCENICHPDRRDEIMRGPPVPSVPGSFSATLRVFLEWIKIAEDVDNMSCLASEDWWVDHAERYEMEVDLGDVEKLVDMTFDDSGENVFERFTLHATVPDSLRGLAQLWKQFLKRVRYEYWERDCKVPHVPEDHAACCPIVRSLGSLNYSMSQVNLRQMDTDTDEAWVVETLDMTQLKNPNVQIRVPVTQSLTHSSMEGLGVHEPDSVARKLVFENMLLSDMEAFKFVNKGCEFEDFIRWYSPKDWDNDAMQLSHRMSGDCVWTRAWEKAQPRPLSQQHKSLFDPKGRGEQILHQLETMRPQDLICQMFVSLFSSACSILSDAYPYDGQVVRDQVEVLKTWSHEVLEIDSMGVSHSLAAKASDMSGLVNMLRCLEHNVSAAVSLDQRLEGIESTVRRRFVNGMIESALNNRQGYELNKEEVRVLVDCANVGGHFSLDGPISTEYSVEMTDADSGSIESRVKHRLFISCLPGELRMATAIHDC
ncbi:hypothetical protein M9434_003783 [Picochlorum sp. BPE23]|nr:hypothetical protein M9434_003783 [Picochlorum sp. BPE23]